MQRALKRWTCAKGEAAVAWPQLGSQTSPLPWIVWREQGLSREGLVALTFLSSLGLSLRPLDLEFMKHLSKVVNIIPVIAKADTMTLEEKSEFKQRVSRRFALFLSRGSFPSSGSELFPSCHGFHCSSTPVSHPNSLPLNYPGGEG